MHSRRFPSVMITEADSFTPPTFRGGTGGYQELEDEGGLVAVSAGGHLTWAQF